jgi:translocation and assembly module TamB
MENDFPADLDVSFQHLDIDALLGIYLPGKITGHSTLAGSVAFRGPLRDSRRLNIVAKLDSLDAEIAHVRLQNVEPIQLEPQSRPFRFRAFTSPGRTDFTAHGRAQLAEPRALDVRVDGTVNMALLRTITPKVSARGMLNLNLSAGGTYSSPVLQGRLELKDTFVSHNDFPSGLSGLNGVLLFDQNRIQIEPERNDRRRHGCATGFASTRMAWSDGHRRHSAGRSTAFPASARRRMRTSAIGSSNAALLSGMFSSLS